MTRHIRRGEFKNGMVLANGGVLTYQHVLILSSNPRVSPYPSANPLPENLESLPRPEIATDAEGEATVETYTAEYDRKGKPSMGFVVLRLKDGRRMVANVEGMSLDELVRGEGIGRKGMVRREKGGERNLFSLGEASRL